MPFYTLQYNRRARGWKLKRRTGNKPLKKPERRTGNKPILPRIFQLKTSRTKVKVLSFVMADCLVIVMGHVAALVSSHMNGSLPLMEAIDETNRNHAPIPDTIL